MGNTLLVSVSGIRGRTLADCVGLADELGRRGVPITWLFAPRMSSSADWVADRAAGGDAVLMHGYDHTVVPSHRAVQLGRRAEFAMLPEHEARLRLRAAGATLERLGLAVDGFAPPRWLASRGTLAAVADAGMPLCADHTAVHDLRGGGSHRARVVGFPGQGAAGSRAETWRCFALVLAAARIARRGATVRLGVDATDLARPGPRQAVLDAVDAAREHGAAGATYPGLVADGLVGEPA